MPRLPVRILAWLAYAVALGVCFVVVAYGSFSIFVRSGVTAVPDLEGVTETAAATLVRDHGLRLDVAAERRYDDAVESGGVVLQRPAAGALVKRGSRVEVVLSLGKERVEVPPLDGRALQAAQVMLNDSGLEVGRTFGVYSSRARPGTIVTQSPAAGAAVGRATGIDVFLSIEPRGETFVMPDLVYRGHREVERYLETRGLRLGSVKFEEYEGIPAGTILRQHPLPGHAVSRFDIVSLVVAARAEAA